MEECLNAFFHGGMNFCSKNREIILGMCGKAVKLMKINSFGKNCWCVALFPYSETVQEKQGVK